MIGLIALGVLVLVFGVGPLVLWMLTPDGYEDAERCIFVQTAPSPWQRLRCWFAALWYELRHGGQTDWRWMDSQIGLDEEETRKDR